VLSEQPADGDYVLAAYGIVKRRCAVGIVGKKDSAPEPKKADGEISTAR
jgi:hypothetical protein